MRHSVDQLLGPTNQEGYFSREAACLYIVSEVEAGAVYQIEDIWDGTQWHKSKKTLPDEAGDSGGALV